MKDKYYAIAPSGNRILLKHIPPFPTMHYWMICWTRPANHEILIQTVDRTAKNA